MINDAEEYSEIREGVRGLCADVAGGCADSLPRQTRSLIQAQSRAAGRQRPRSLLPRRPCLHEQIGVGQKAVDRDRAELLRGMHHEDRHVPGEQRAERRLHVDCATGSRNEEPGYNL